MGTLSLKMTFLLELETVKHKNCPPSRPKQRWEISKKKNDQFLALLKWLCSKFPWECWSRRLCWIVVKWEDRSRLLEVCNELNNLTSSTTKMEFFFCRIFLENKTAFFKNLATICFAFFPSVESMKLMADRHIFVTSNTLTWYCTEHKISFADPYRWLTIITSS